MARALRKTRAVSAKGVKPLELYEHQQRAVDAYTQENVNRFFLGWHRRAGKDVFALDFARERMQERVGTYWHLFPFHIQAKRAIWKGIDARTGQRFIDRAFPKAIRETENDTEMSLSITNGSAWQMLGSDNYDRMVGSNPCGVIFSEWALCDPAAWDYIRPILVENKGWAMFITTFRGRNHAWRMSEAIKKSENWYHDIRTIDQTHKHDGTPIVTRMDVQRERDEGMDEALIRQEFYCDPDAASSGAIFAKQHLRLSEISATVFKPNNRILRIAWGMHEEGIAAVAFQDSHIVGTHTFLEQNIVDAVQAVTRRHPNMQMIHHALHPDPAVFNQLDGYGVVTSLLGTDRHMRDGAVAALLNTCSVVPASRETLIDFAMSYAPYRDALDEEDYLTHPALSQALAVMHSAQPLSSNRVAKPMNYSGYDRGVI